MTRLLLTVPEAAEVMAISRSKLYQLLASGAVASIRIDGSSLWRRRSTYRSGGAAVCRSSCFGRSAERSTEPLRRLCAARSDDHPRLMRSPLPDSVR